MQKAKAKSKARTKPTKARATKKPAAQRGPVKHVKRVLSLTPKFVHGMVVGAFVGLLVVGVLRQVSPASALNLTVSRDCTPNAVIKCGAITTDELKSRYSQAGVAAIYRYYGITADDIKNIGSTALAGTAYKDGSIRLTASGTLVATGSTSAGRQPISGSTRLSSGGVTFYDTPSTKAFRSNALAVYVVMNDGQFKFAIVPNCGNPMRATPVPKPKPKPEPTPPASIVETPPPPPASLAPIPVVAPIPAEALPVTGPSEMLVVGLLAVIGGYIFHITHRHVRHRRHARSFS